MSKKHYVAVAQILSATPITDDAHASAIVKDRDEIARRLADVFADDNPRFDRARFLVAAGCDIGK